MVRRPVTLGDLHMSRKRNKESQNAEFEWPEQMVGFVTAILRRMDPRFVAERFPGPDVGSAAAEIVRGMLTKARGNRSPKGQMTTADEVAVMDQICQFHLLLHHFVDPGKFDGLLADAASDRQKMEDEEWPKP